MENKKILVTATTFPRWKNDSTPPFVFELERRIAKTYSTIILAPHYPGAKKEERWESLTIKRYRYFFPESLQKLCYGSGILTNLKKNKLLYVQVPFLLLSQFLISAWTIKKEKIDLIHAHWIIPQGLIAVFLKKLFNVPYVVTVHGDDVLSFTSPLKKRLLFFCLNHCSACTVNSSATEKIVKHINNKISTSIVPMGVDRKKFNPIKKDLDFKNEYAGEGKLILFVGRLVKKKGVGYLIRAMKMVVDKFPECVLLIIGDGAMSAELKTLVKINNLDKNIIFKGSVLHSELPVYFASADIVVGPSTSDGFEGLGVVFIEALSSGTSVIASNVGGVADVVIDKKTGILVDEKNPDQIARSIIYLFENPVIKQQLVLNGLNHVKKVFSWDIIVQKFSNIFNSII